MPAAAMSPFTDWENFYVIVGSSGAALIGLQFVVIALVAESRSRSTPHEIATFGTPTILHFSAALLLSAILSAPWREASNAALAIGACGLTGVGYVLVVIRRTLHQTRYIPVLEDWLWHVLFPFLAYGALLTSAILLRRNPETVLFIIGSATLLLLFIGIHNSWDTVTYIAVKPKTPERSEGKKGDKER